MNTIEELIQKECPEGVEYYSIKELFDTRNGYTPSKNNPEYWENGDVPWFRMEDIRANGRILSDSILHVNMCAVKGNLFPKDSLIIATSATIGEHALLKCDSLSNQRFTYLMLKSQFKDKADIKFLFYYCFILDKWCLENVNQGGFASVNMPAFYNFEFPVPPLSVQHKIVEILDNFTSLEAELEAELEARKKQYEYYRNQLLDFTGREDVEWKTLPEISINYDSQRKPIKSSQRESGHFPYYGASGIVDYVDGYIFDGDYLLISEDGANLLARSTKIAFSISGKNWVNNHAHVLKFNDDNLRKFVEYYVEHLDLTLYISAGAQPKLTKDKLNKIPIPLPNEEEINRIVTILDKFEALINGQTASLAAEIKARHQQYEYYRDRLLYFKRK